MLYQYTINKKTSWSSLPWKKIYTKIAIIQYKIYKNSMHYKFNKVYKLQKYLLNSNEAKIATIIQIVEKIRIYYSNKKKFNLLISDEQKFNILQNFYNHNKKYSINLYFLMKQVRLWITFLSIQPEWQAKFIYNFNYYTKTLNKKYAISWLDSYLDQNKKIDFIKITKKNANILNYIKTFNLNKYFQIYNLLYFISYISFNHLYWHKQYIKKIFSLSKIKIKQIFILKRLTSVQNNKLLMRLLVEDFKIYIKNLFKINDLFIAFINNIKLNFSKINTVLFYRLRKNCHNLLYKKYLYFISINKYLNKIFYVLKIQCFYNSYCY
uniref:Reverse transcriptase N-terminal domain-containing protein n=1 Tax=Caloglossa beccarii TaxID=131038 RepID=A0A1Z1M8Q3_9FLOR|nr:hypothetical protein [Caloglossa beccarii]ARW62263.1 hypothetical protein [Caloglossa beccarii]